MNRSLDSIRSKLSELRKDTTLFDRKGWAWKDEEVQRWIRIGQEEEVQHQLQIEVDEEE
jgi:hypothetical protein